jgi:hypothetical protein
MPPLILDPPTGTSAYRIHRGVQGAQVTRSWISREFTTDIQDVKELEFTQEREAFLNIPQDLLAPHAGRFVASHRGNILDSDQDLHALVTRVFRHGDKPVYITKVGEDHDELRLDTPFFD